MKSLSSKLLVAVLLIGAACCIANAQTTVKSITTGKTYTEKQILSILGTPEKKFKKDYGEIHAYYIYKDAQFIFRDGRLLEFGIKTSKFPVMTDKVPGGVKVGDNISKVKKIKSLVCQQQEDDKDCYIIGHFQMIDQPDYVIYVKNDIITDIIFAIPD